MNNKFKIYKMNLIINKKNQISYKKKINNSKIYKKKLHKTYNNR